MRGWLRLETHILDFPEDLYDQRTDVELVRLPRPETKFDDTGSPNDQLRQDCRLARKALAARAQANGEKGA